MPIRSVKEIAARRAAEKAAADQARTSDPPAIPTAPPEDPVAQPQPPRRGHAVKDDEGKWQPTGDYEQGWCRPPAKNQFKPGGSGGPGRPKGSIGHDTMMRKHLRQTRLVRIEGRTQKIANRELVVMTTVKEAVEGKYRDSRRLVLGELSRLFPETRPVGQTASRDEPPRSAADEAILATLRGMIADEILAENASNDEPEDIA